MRRVLRRDNPTSLEFWRVNGRQVKRIAELPYHAFIIASSADGRWLASAGADGIIELFNPAAPHARQSLVGHYREITSLEFSNDGRTLVSTSKDGTARLWSVATGSELCVLVDGERPLHSADFLPDGHTLAICGEERENGASLLIFRTE